MSMAIPNGADTKWRHPQEILLGIPVQDYAKMVDRVIQIHSDTHLGII